MFETIEKESGGGRGPEFLSSHPNPGNRRERIAEESKKLTISSERRNQPEEFARAQANLKRMAPAPSMEEIVKSGKAGSGAGNDRVGKEVERPSDRYRTFEADGLFELSLPDNWKEIRNPSSVTFAPDGAHGTVQGESVFTHGAIAGITEARTSDLRAASEQYIDGILKGNTYLKTDGGFERQRLDGQDALRRRLTGQSNVTGRREIVDVHTSLLRDGRLFYLVQVVPDNEEGRYEDAFDKMVESLRFQR
jgi:hypothetical protein